jgi:hypothetical protein
MIALFLFFPRDFGEIFGTHFFKNMTREEAEKRNANNDARCLSSICALARKQTNEEEARCCFLPSLDGAYLALSLFVRLKLARVCALALVLLLCFELSLF